MGTFSGVNVLKVTVVRGFGAVAGFLLTLCVTSLADTNDAGMTFLFITASTVMGSLLSIGSPNFILRCVGALRDSDWQKINLIHSKLLTAIFIFSTPLFVTTIMFADSISYMLTSSFNFSKLVPFIALGSLFFALLLFFTNSLIGVGKTLSGSITQNGISQFIFIVLASILFLYSAPLSANQLVTFFLIGLFSAVCFGIRSWYVLPNTRLSYSKWSLWSSRESLSSFWLLIVMSQIIQFAGQFAVAKTMSSADVAFFTAALRLALVSSFILIAVNIVVAPLIANAYQKKDFVQIDRLALKSGRLMFIITTPVSLILIFGAERVLLIFGPEYFQAANAFRFLVFAQYINVLSGSVGYILNMTNNEKYMRNVVFVSGITSVTLSLLLTPVFGLEGAAIATGMALCAQNLLAVKYVKEKLGFNTLNLFRQP